METILTFSPESFAQVLEQALRAYSSRQRRSTATRDGTMLRPVQAKMKLRGFG